jgi:dsRNA-specific ribonuclease
MPSGVSQVKALSVHVPGVLSDVFESIAGAIFLDSSFSLSTVERAFNPILQHAYGNKNII